MSIASLSRETGLTVSWITSLVEALSQGGLVTRIGSPEDRRVSIVCLTEDGERAFRDILPLMGEAMAQTCGNLDEEEKQQLLSLLHRLL
jgi:MarR family 2-MHQ and catechol resistance regulon transcriptional repressor